MLFIMICVCVCVCAVVSGDESEGEEGEGERRAEVTLKMKQAMLEEEKQALLQNKELLDEVSALFNIKVILNHYPKSKILFKIATT